MTNQIKKLPRDELIELMTHSCGIELDGAQRVRDNINTAETKSKATELVVFECLEKRSSHYGQRTLITVGPGCRYKNVRDTENTLRWQYLLYKPIAWCRTLLYDAERKEMEEEEARDQFNEMERWTWGPDLRIEDEET